MAGHITLHNQTASSTLAVNDIRSLLDLHRRQRPQRHMSAAWHGEERVPDGLYISPSSFAKADHEVKHLALLVDLSHGHTQESSGDEPFEPSHRETVAGRGLAVKVESHLRNL